MASAVATPLSAAEYLAFEQASEVRHEWIEGEVREMSGGSRRHSLIASRIGTLLDVATMRQPFEVYDSNMRVRIPDGPYYYPDVAVAPSPPQLEDERADTLLNPLIVVECLSPSTAAIDRGEKLDHYRLIPSLTDYLIVAQDRVRIERHFRQGAGWRLRTLTDPADVLTLPGLGVALPLAAIYDRIFPAAE